MYIHYMYVYIYIYIYKYEKKTQLFIHNKYFAVLYRSFVNVLK